MLRRVQQYIERHNLLRPHERVLVGVSGGADSMALLHILHRLGYECVALHCHFHLRGDESDRDMHFVEETCNSWGIRLHTKHFDTKAYAHAEGVSIEMAARDLRYTWFEEMITSERCAAIAVAHHQNDQAETMLMHLSRGTGIRGLMGMRPKRDRIIRPLLCLTRNEIETYCQTEQIAYITDSTNADITIPRNAVRARLKNSAESDIIHMADTAEWIQGYGALIEKCLPLIKKQVILPDEEAILRISVPAIMETGEAAEVLLYELLRAEGASFAGEEIKHIMQACVNPDANGQLFRKDGYILTSERGNLILRQEEDHLPLRYRIETQIIETTPGVKPHFPDTTAYMAYVDADKIGTKPLKLRTWQTGDRFYPLGMHGSKKLQDFFVDMKVENREKDRIPVICAGEDIVWIAGYRIDNRYKWTPQTTHIMQITIINDIC